MHVFVTSFVRLYCIGSVTQDRRGRARRRGAGKDEVGETPLQCRVFFKT